MSNAELQQYGTRDDLYHRPVNRFVADFIGEPPTNFFAGEIVQDSDGMALRVGGSGLTFRPDAARSAVTAAETGPCAPLEYEPPDLNSLSRLRALRQMDCIASLMDQKLASGESVTMSREELERIRSLAISARVAAQLIGR